MYANEEMQELIGITFISYAKKCLKRIRKDYYKKKTESCIV